MALPSTKVEVAFNAGFTTPAGSRVWTDVSTYVLGQNPVKITRGRQDEVSQTPPSKLSLALNNKDGRFTPEKTGGAYYPNVKLGRPIRITVTYNAVNYVRFLGFTDDWAPGWPDGTDADSVTTVTASSRLARLGRDAELKSVIAEEVFDDAPSAIYALDEPSTATSGVDSSGNSHPPLVNAGGGASVAFGDETAGWVGAKFANGKYLASGESITVNGSTVATFIARFRTSTVPSGGNLGSLFGGPAQTVPTPLVVNGATGGSLGSGVGGGLDTSPTLVTDGVDHVGILVVNAGTATLYLDGVSFGSAAINPSTFFVRPGDGFTGVESYVGYFPTALSPARALAISQAMLTGFAGESAGARIVRYAGYSGVPAAEVSADTGLSLIGVVDSEGQVPVELMRKVEKTEGGVLYDAKDGTLTFKDRDARYNAAAAFTLNATSQEVEADLEPKYDDQFLFNDVSAVANGVPAGRVTDTTSTNENGFYRDTLDTVTDSITDALAGAQWKVGLGKDPHSRYGQVSVDVVNSSTSQAAAVMGAEIGTRFDLTSLPSQAPATTAELFVEGYEETITSAAHTVKFNTSPTYGYTGSGTNGVWQLGVAGRSELGDTTRLAF